jgi:hypothetical protein
MTRSASLPGAEFDAFLYAAVGEEGNGMLLSVLSALARLDVDPWDEAARLAQLPPKTAAQSLASLILALPGVPRAQSDPDTMARLVGLLPRPASSKTATPAVAAVAGTAINSWSAIIAVYIILTLGAHLIMESPQPPVQVGSARSLTQNRDSPADAASGSPAVTIGSGAISNGEIKQPAR